MSGGTGRDWYRGWQHQEHVALFDGRARLTKRQLIRNYEAFNDVRLLKEHLDPARSVTLLEVGCATGEFSRYVQCIRPAVRYYGVDISAPAIARAKQKYPDRAFFVMDPSVSLAEGLKALGIPGHPEVVYAKDVLQHQTQPFLFLSALLQVASEMAILRCRTRDVGPSELNPEVSCQYHYEGWMPYLVLNLQELIDCIKAEVPGCEVVVYRHHMILGGQEHRFLPKDCYLKETGTAETAIGVFKTTTHPGRVVVEDRPDQNPTYRWDDRLKLAVRQAWTALRIPEAIGREASS